MKTLFLLMAQFDGKAIIPVEDVCRECFDGLAVEEFLRKTTAGDIALPVVRMYASQKAAKGVNVNDLADYIDRLTAEARRELEKVLS